MRAPSQIYRHVPASSGALAVDPGASAWGQDYYRHAPVVALVLIAVVAARLHEILPYVYKVRPALTMGLGGSLLVLSQSGSGVLQFLGAHRGLRLLSALFLWAALTAPFALWPSAAGTAAISQFLPILLMSFVILACEPTESNLRRLTFGFVAAAAIHGLLLLPNRMIGVRLGSTSSLDPNDLAALMVICFPFSVAMALQNRGLQRWLAWGAATVFVAIVVFSGSRGGTIAMVVAALVYVLSAKGSRRVLAFVLLLAAGALTWQVAPGWFRTRMRTITATEDDYNTFAYEGRKQIWARARLYIRQHPVAGVGMNNFPVAEGNHLTSLGIRGKWSNTHNAYLQVTSELGFVGAAFFVAFMVAAGRRALELRRSTGRGGDSGGAKPEFIAALAGFAVGAYFLSHAYFYAYYALAALIFFAYRVRQASGVGPVNLSVSQPVFSRAQRGFRSLRTAHFRAR